MASQWFQYWTRHGRPLMDASMMINEVWRIKVSSGKDSITVIDEGEVAA